MPDENPFDQLPRALVSLRERQGLKQAAAARLTGLAKQTLSAYEAGKTAPSLATLGKILVAYKTDVEVLGRALKSQAVREEARVGPPSAEEIEATVLRALRHFGLLPGGEAEKKPDTESG